MAMTKAKIAIKDTGKPRVLPITSLADIMTNVNDASLEENCMTSSQVLAAIEDQRVIDGKIKIDMSKSTHYRTRKLIDTVTKSGKSQHRTKVRDEAIRSPRCLLTLAATLEAVLFDENGNKVHNELMVNGDHTTFVFNRKKSDNDVVIVLEDFIGQKTTLAPKTYSLPQRVKLTAFSNAAGDTGPFVWTMKLNAAEARSMNSPKEHIYFEIPGCGLNGDPGHLYFVPPGVDSETMFEIFWGDNGLPWVDIIRDKYWKIKFALSKKIPAELRAVFFTDDEIGGLKYMVRNEVQEKVSRKLVDVIKHNASRKSAEQALD